MQKKKLGIVSKIYIALIVFFLYAPIGVLIFMSFNKGNTTVWKGFSLKWYGELFKSTRLMNALGNTLIIAALASVLATILGTAAAIGINNFRGKSLGVIFHFEMGFGTVLISHICFCVPFVVLNVMPRLRRMDQSIYDAALDLGCNQWQAFYKVVIHELMPGILSGMLMSFTYSVDDFVITHFTQGAKFNNLSTEIYAMLRRKIPPTINALSTLLFVAIVVIMVLINVFERRAEKKQAKLK